MKWLRAYRAQFLRISPNGGACYPQSISGFAQECAKLLAASGGLGLRAGRGQFLHISPNGGVCYPKTISGFAQYFAKPKIDWGVWAAPLGAMFPNCAQHI